MDEDERENNGVLPDRPEAMERDVVESRTVARISREALFAALLDVERFPEWGYGLRRARVHHVTSARRGLCPGDRIEFGLRAAGLSHQVTSVVTVLEPPRLIEWRYISGASGSGGWLLEDAGGKVRMTLSTDYSIEPAWLSRVARRPFFRGVVTDLLRRSLERLEKDLRHRR